MVLIDAYEFWTVVLGILLSFYLDFMLVLSYFRFRSVLPKLWASFGKIGEQYDWRSANSIVTI